MEKYGEVPKKFTKKWWGYFWDYYKWHTIATVFIVMLAATVLHQCGARIHYDTTITISGGHGLDEELLESVEADLAEITEDTNGDGEKHVMIQQLISPPAAEGEMRDAQYEMAIATKVMVEFAAGESCVYFLSEGEVNKYLNDSQNDGFFVPVEEYAATMPDKSRLMSARGVAYAVNLGELRFFAERGIDASEYYLMIRNPRYNETDDEKAILRTESAKKIAAYIIAE